MAARKLKLAHPGKILREEFMEPVRLSAYALAKSLDVPLPRVNDIVREKRAISLKRPCCCRRISARRSATGSTFRPTTILRWQRNGWASTPREYSRTRTTRAVLCSRSEQQAPVAACRCLIAMRPTFAAVLFDLGNTLAAYYHAE